MVADAGEASISEPAAMREKPIIVRVKRKTSQTCPDTFCELPFYLPFSLPPSNSSFNFYLINREVFKKNIFSIRAGD
jgi:hypothetical protein